MQTFLPYPDFVQSLNTLDYRRLNKQKVEAYQLINLIEKLHAHPDQKIAWKNHPARFMWHNHLHALKCYYNLSVLIWQSKGYKNAMKLKDFSLPFMTITFPEDTQLPMTANAIAANLEILTVAEKHIEKPPFIGNHDFHISHQSNLVRKLPSHYQPQFPNVPPDLPYIWPTTG